MNRDDKARILKFLSDQLSESRIYVFAEFSGLSVAEMEDFRRSMKKLSGRVMVVKNTLFKRFFQSSSISMDEAGKFMEGPNFIIWSRTGDEAEIVKEVLKFARSSNKIKVKFGVLNNAFMDSGSIEQLGRIPGRKVLQAMLICSIRAPLSNLVYNVKYPLTRLIMVLKTFSEKKEKGNG